MMDFKGFWVGTKLVNLEQVVWFDRENFEIRLSSGDLIKMEETDFNVVVATLTGNPSGEVGAL